MRKYLAVLIPLILCAVSAVSQNAPALRHDRSVDKWADKTLRKMSLEEKVGQMFVVWARVQFLNINNPEYAHLRDEIQKYHVGGFGLTVPVEGPTLAKSLPLEAAVMTNELQRDSKLPLFIAADFERGLSMRLNGATAFPHAMAFGATGNKDYAYQSGKITAEESRAIGVQWNWFPDADVNSNPANPIINTRSFGEDPAMVSQMVTAYIAGAHAGGMLTTAKHFPGHGDTDTDTHLAMARVNGDMQRLESLELPPFKAAIAAGVDAIMVAHVTVPALEPDPDKVATISHNIVTGLLKDKMGFKGLVVTDALEMNGLMRLFQPGTRAEMSARAAVAAVLAGDDMLLIPGDLDGAYNGVLNAVRSGQIQESRINDSVRKILVAKASVGLNKHRFVDINAVNKIVASPESLALAQQIADDAVTLVRDNHQVFPLEPSAAGTSQSGLAYHAEGPGGNSVLAVIFSDDVRGDSGRVLERQLRSRIHDARVIYVDEGTAGPRTPEIMDLVAKAHAVIAAVYVAPSAGRTAKGGNSAGSIAMDEGQAALLHQILQAANSRTAVVALGNPYVASSVPEVQNYICTFSNAPVSEISAVKALFGEIPMRGHLPVTIPGIAPRGFSLLDKPAQPASGS